MIQGDAPKTLGELPHSAWELLALVAEHPGMSSDPCAASLHLERCGLAILQIVGEHVAIYPTKLGAHLAEMREAGRLDLRMRFDRYTEAKVKAERCSLHSEKRARAAA